jgi:hypothetical protein
MTMNLCVSSSTLLERECQPSWQFLKMSKQRTTTTRDFTSKVLQRLFWKPASITSMLKVSKLNLLIRLRLKFMKQSKTLPLKLWELWPWPIKTSNKVKVVISMRIEPEIAKSIK